MECDMKPTGQERNGRREFRCARGRCRWPAVWIPETSKSVHQKCQLVGAGDRLSLWLANYGITKQSYLQKKRWIYAKLGLPEPKNCNCGKRQQRINSWYLDAVQAYRRIRNLIGA